MSKLDSKIPEGPLEQKWEKYKSSVALVNPANKRSLEVIVVGLTSATEDLYFSHFSSNGPSGILLSNFDIS